MSNHVYKPSPHIYIYIYIWIEGEVGESYVRTLRAQGQPFLNGIVAGTISHPKFPRWRPVEFVHRVGITVPDRGSYVRHEYTMTVFILQASGLDNEPQTTQQVCVAIKI